MNKTVFKTQFDGMKSLVDQFGEDEFVRFAISSCFFFSKDLVDMRHKTLCRNIEEGIAVPARLSTNKKYYGGKKLKRKTQEVIFNDNETGKILTKIDGNGNANIDSLITNLTGYYLKGNKSRTPDFINYKISHIWGNSFHPCYFTSLWNVVLVPLFVNDILDKPSAVNGTYHIGAKILNTLKAIIYTYYGLESYDWNSLGIQAPSYDKSFVLPGSYTINVLSPCENKVPLKPVRVEVTLTSETSEIAEQKTSVSENVSDLEEEDQIRELLRSIGMKTFVEIIYPALKRNINISVADLSDKDSEFSQYTVNAQNTRLSKSRKLFENGWENIALQIIADSYRVEPGVRVKAKEILTGGC